MRVCIPYQKFLLLVLTGQISLCTDSPTATKYLIVSPILKNTYLYGWTCSYNAIFSFCGPCEDVDLYIYLLQIYICDNTAAWFVVPVSKTTGRSRFSPTEEKERRDRKWAKYCVYMYLYWPLPLLCVYMCMMCHLPIVCCLNFMYNDWHVSFAILCKTMELQLCLRWYCPLLISFVIVHVHVFKAKGAQVKATFKLLAFQLLWFSQYLQGCKLCSCFKGL